MIQSRPNAAFGATLESAVDHQRPAAAPPLAAHPDVPVKVPAEVGELLRPTARAEEIERMEPGWGDLVYFSRHCGSR